MRPSNRNEFAIAIICALTLEAEAVEDLFDETYDRLGEYYGKQPRDDNAYVNGRIGKHNVVLCYMPGMGKGSAASVASSLKISYKRVEVALVVGICGGAPYPSSGGEIFLGDVIISDSVVQYDFGRQYPGRFEKKIEVKDTLGRPNQAIRALLANLQARRSRNSLQEKLSRHLQTLQESQPDWHYPTSVDDFLFKASYQHKHYNQEATCSCLDSTSEDICKTAVHSSCTLLGCDLAQVRRCRPSTEHDSPRVHIGMVASADTVMKSGEHRDRLVESEGVVGFEMEGAGVWDNISCIIIKGVCDYADSHKNKAWQLYGAATGAAAAKAFLEYWEPTAREVSFEHIRIQSKIQIPTSVFFGREKELNRLFGSFDLTVPTRQTAVIWGFSGYGKTRLALEYIHTRRAQYESVLWIDSSSRAMIEQACENICSQLPSNARHGHPAVDTLLSWLGQGINSSWIMVFDGVESFDGDDSVYDLDIRTFFPSCDHGHILLITTSPDLHMRLGFSDIPVRNVDDQTGAKILLRCARGNIEDSSIQTKAMAISRKLGGMPLAIQQAGCLLSYGMISLSDYNQQFRMRYQDKTLNFPLRKYVGSYEKGRTLWTTFDMLYSALVQRSMDATQLLILTAFLGRGRIPFSIISGKTIDENSSEPSCAISIQSQEIGYVPELLQWLIELRSDIGRLALAVRELEASGFAVFHKAVDGISIESFTIHDLARTFIRSKVSRQQLSGVLATSFLVSGLHLYDGCSMLSETSLRKHIGRLVAVLDLFLADIPGHMLAPTDGQYFRLCAVVAPVYARVCRLQGNLDTAANLWTIALQYQSIPGMGCDKGDLNREHYMEAANVDVKLGNYKDAIQKYSMVVIPSDQGHQQEDELAILASGYLRQARERYEQHKQDLERAVTAFSSPKAVRHSFVRP
ncbi:hypothetical protein BJY00DRAFT_287767 [Aspergillus carlsbadensis]|nr:hypothetical protein BJY00DRAFT_287767 [Aspergillus carlsbadensis]